MHSLLLRQLRRHLGEPQALPPAWQPFLAAVDEAYRQADNDREMIERSLEKMSRELLERNRDLRQRLAEQAALIHALGEARDQLIQSEKMASIGQLAAGVAHEINNPTGFVQANLGVLGDYLRELLILLDDYEAAEMELPAEVAARLRERKEATELAYLREDAPNLLRETQEGIERVRRIVRDLKDFSHVGEAEWQPADLEKGLNSTLNVVWNELKYKCEVVKEYAGLPEVICLASQINQVFMNLLVNAAQAIEDRGTLTLRTGQRDDAVWVEVEDTGQGIPAENLKRIFEPFFTTKPVGKGTGLGLSVSWNIVQRHGGRIEVDSEVGRGTRFRVWLPKRRNTTTDDLPADTAGGDNDKLETIPRNAP